MLHPSTTQNGNAQSPIHMVHPFGVSDNFVPSIGDKDTLELVPDFSSDSKPSLNKKIDVEMDNYIKGTCMEMCPLDEIKMREKEKLLHVLEMSPGKVVKSFSRSAAGKKIKASDLRPPSVLLKTIKYLFCNVINTKRLPFHTVYDFISDRLLAVRQDMVVQNVPKAESITILQPIVRFYAYSAYRLCEENTPNFDATLNNNHLQECLKKLLYIYDRYDYLNLDIKTLCNDYIIENRPEFEALYLIFNLGNDEALRRSLTIPRKCQTTVVKEAMKLSFAFKYGNFVKACRIIRDLPELLAAVGALHLQKIRRKALEVMSTGYSSKNLSFPCEALQEILLYGNKEELLQDCQYYDIKHDKERIYFSQKSFNRGKPTKVVGKVFFVECKNMEDNLSFVILGL